MKDKDKKGEKGISEKHRKLLLDFLSENNIPAKEVLDSLSSYYKSEIIVLAKKLEDYYCSEMPKNEKMRKQTEILLDVTQLKLFNTNLKQLEV